MPVRRDADSDLDFPLQLEKAELETLVDCICDTVGRAGK
jgi:hypothetical protein